MQTQSLAGWSIAQRTSSDAHRQRKMSIATSGIVRLFVDWMTVATVDQRNSRKCLGRIFPDDEMFDNEVAAVEAEIAIDKDDAAP